MPSEQEAKKTEELIAGERDLRTKFFEDPLRPSFHFMPPAAWMNDINGTTYWKGRYHIFYQYNPDEAFWKLMHLGHASSLDLVHWVHHPFALAPTLGGPDRDGIFSGGAFTIDGKAAFIYHGLPDGMCIATSDDDLLISWTKHPSNPLIKVPKPGEPGFGEYIVYDPCAWNEGDAYAALIGNSVPGISGNCTTLFRSSDATNWKPIGPFYDPNPEWTLPLEDCAIPDFFPLGDRHMLLFGSHLVGTQYYIGRYEGDRFHIETHGRMNWHGGHLGGARTLLDAKGRRIFFDWIRELRGADLVERESGWSGITTIPRILSLMDDGTLGIEPVPELEILRMNHRSHANLRVSGEMNLSDVSGDCLEISLDIDPGYASEFGIKVLCSPDGSEETEISCNPAAKTLRIDVTNASLDKTISYEYYRTRPNDIAPWLNPELIDDPNTIQRTYMVQDAPFELDAGELLRLRVFIDRSVIEVFANGRQCITHRVYPTLNTSKGVRLFSRGGDVTVKTLDAWDMGPIH